MRRMRQKTIIAEDHDYFRKIFKQYLEGLENITVIAEAENGKIVVESISRLKPDLIIMDVNMPEMDGISASRIIKRQHPDIKIILYSMYSLELDLKEVNSKADAFVLKDNLFKELPDIIDKLQYSAKK